MEANKVTVCIKVEALCLDSVSGLVMEALDQISRCNEKASGELKASDGDEVSWSTSTKTVQF